MATRRAPNNVTIDKKDTFKLFPHHLVLMPAFLILLSALMIRQSSPVKITINFDSINVFDIFLNYIIYNNWHIGVSIGCLFSVFKRNSWPLRLSTIIFGGLLLPAIAPLIITIPTYIDIQPFCVGSFLSGISYGFIYCVLLTHIADNASKKNRGSIVTNLLLVEFSAPYLLFVNAENYEEYYILALILIALSLTWLLPNDSIIVSIKSNKFDEAERIFTKLNKNILDSTEIHNEINEMSKMVQEDYQGEEFFITCSPEIFLHGNWYPLFLLSALRIVTVLLNLLMIIIIGNDFDLYVLLMICKLLTAIIPKFTLDKVGRRKLLLISEFCCVITMGSLIVCMSELNYSLYSDYTHILIIICTVTLAIGIEPLRHLYACEAFPLSKRNASIAFVTIIERNVYMLGFFFLFEKMFDYVQAILIVGLTISILLLVLLAMFLPETKNKTIRQCRTDFNSYYQRYHNNQSTAAEI